MSFYELDARAVAVKDALSALGLVAGSNIAPVGEPAYASSDISAHDVVGLSTWAAARAAVAIGDLEPPQGTPIASVRVRVVPDATRYADILQISVEYGAP